MLIVDALMRVKLLSPWLDEGKEYDLLVSKTVSMLRCEEESFFKDGQPPLMMRDLNEQVNGIMMPGIATTYFWRGDPASTKC